MILNNNISDKFEGKNKWILTNQYPFYFIKQIENKKYEAVSMFFADNTVIVEYHRINSCEIPDKTRKEVESDISGAVDDNLLEFFIIETSLTDGYGDILSSKTYKNNAKDIDDINLFLSNLKINAILEPVDFEVY